MEQMNQVGKMMKAFEKFGEGSLSQNRHRMWWFSCLDYNISAYIAFADSEHVET
jgi:hypothetical protein